MEHSTKWRETLQSGPKHTKMYKVEGSPTYLFVYNVYMTFCTDVFDG